MESQPARTVSRTALIIGGIVLALLIIGICAYMSIFSAGTIGPGPPVDPGILGGTPDTGSPTPIGPLTTPPAP